ncbi:GAF and ANTAR domain-containing protein [Streptomyces minutiscleroticus]|uniref:ANTAR domain-containing protein n=1 Tax=Streptomyces minutiscleroticus TaxID=68238 RepID=A0A918P3T9_9ACTN|nr:GAF and ANTAR domain-containing protein [Streptomyces minutiscleroticus]GGY16569.1 hypothetical protein GCM10010358_80300 [Streptomyces minutiscleroticus]
MAHDEFTRLLHRLHQAALDGRDLSAASAATAARLLHLQALTLSLRAASGTLEPLWGTTADGLGAGLEEWQYTLGEGPTVDAARTAKAVTEADLTTPAAAQRWPVFTPAACDTPARAVIAVPLRLGVATVGTLTGYRTTPGPFTVVHRLEFDAFARTALNLLLNTQPDTLADPTGTAPGPDVSLHHAEIHQATGFLSSRLDITIEDALLRLRAHAFSHNRPLSDVAHDVLAERLHLALDP